MVKNTNDGSSDAPRLRVYLNLGTLLDLPANTLWQGGEGDTMVEDLAKDGFEGIQYMDGVCPAQSSHPLGNCVSDRINTASQADEVAAKYADKGFDCLTVHAGWGIEDDKEVFNLVEAILNSSEKFHIPIYLETHRATITQDIWRTAQIIKRFPGIRFNGDFSHYYTGQELVYGGVEMKYTFMAPIFERVRFMHARIGSPGCMQVSIGNGEERPLQAHGLVNYLHDFKEMWILAMTGFLKTARPGDYLIFCPELLSGTYYYARKFPDAEGNLVEESDRYQQALLYKSIAYECFAEAKRRSNTTHAG